MARQRKSGPEIRKVLEQWIAEEADPEGPCSCCHVPMPIPLEGPWPDGPNWTIDLGVTSPFPVCHSMLDGLVTRAQNMYLLETESVAAQRQSA